MNMKKVVSGDELRNKMQEAVNLLCDTVKTTLGPKGSNCIIDHSAFSPFITNDGVTIAENIESDDEVVNTILELAKEASIKTNTTVGDGTTTTLVLLQSIFNTGLKEIEKGENPIFLKKRLERELSPILEAIREKSKVPTEKELYNIAKTSGGMEEIGINISEAYQKVSEKSAIRIQESEEEQTKQVYRNGYSFDTLLASSYFLGNKKEIELIEPFILIIQDYVSNIEEVAYYLNEAIKKEKPIIIMAEDYQEDVVNELLALNFEDKIKVYPLKTPEFGNNKLELLKDISFVSEAKVLENEENPLSSYLGFLPKVLISEKETTLYFNRTERIKKRIQELKAVGTKKDEFAEKRIAMLDKGLIDICVGAPTQTERREKKMHYDDALCAVASAKDGVLPGSGLVLYEIAEKENILPENALLKEALTEPIKQILWNGGLDVEKVLETIKKSNYETLYNIKAEKYEFKNETSVIDATSVIENSLKHAVSIAGMLLTTTSIVINEYQNNAHKINDFNDL